MRQTLFYIPCHIAGMPVFGVGLFLLLWVLLGLGMLAMLAKQGRLKEELVSYLLILIPMGLAIALLLPHLCEPRGLPIRSYGMMMLIAVVSGAGLAAWRARRAGMSPDVIYSLAFWLFVPGIVGARAFYVIEYWDDKYWPIYQLHGLQAFLGSVVNVAEGGLVVYGSLFGAAVGFIAFVRKFKMPVLALGDLIAPSMMLGLALGRVGCLLNGCCFGGACDYPWAVTFPFGSPPHVHQAQRGAVPLHGLLLEPDSQGRLEIADVVAGSPAEKAGLAPGDVLRQINSITVDSVSAARWALLDARKLNLLIQWDKESYIHWLIELPPDPEATVYHEHDGQVELFGMTVAESADEGLVVAAVRGLTPAAKQDVRPGQKIIAVNARPVRTPAEFCARIDEFHRAPWIQVRTVENKAARWTLAEPPERSLPVHPTQLYSVVNASVLCLLLLAYTPFRRRDGEVVALMLTVYAVTRYLLEDIRTDEAPIFFTGLSISQNVSLLLLLAIAVLWFYILRQPRRS